MSDHYHDDYVSTNHDHRGQYAEDRHDHDGDYAALHHRHYDDESTARGLREDLGHAEERIRQLEDDLRGALAFIRVLDRLRPTCVICRDATADRQTVNGPACTDCVGDLPDDGPGPERPETWAFPGGEESSPDPEGGEVRELLNLALMGVNGLQAANTRLTAALREAAAGHEEVHRAGMADEAQLAIAAELAEAFTAFSAALDGQLEQPDEDPEPEPYDPGPEIDDEGGMSEYRYYVMPEDYQRGQS